MSPTRTTIPSPRAFAIAAPLLLLVLAGCGSAGNAADTGAGSEVGGGETEPSTVEVADTASGESVEEGAAAGAGEATFEIAGQSYAFSPTTCIVGEEDVLVSGPGAHVGTGDLAFLDVDVTLFDGEYVGGVDVELGTDQPFTSADDYYRLDPLVNADGFAVVVDGRSFTAEGQFRANGETALEAESFGPGRLTVRWC